MPVMAGLRVTRGASASDGGLIDIIKRAKKAQLIDLKGGSAEGC